MKKLVALLLIVCLAFAGAVGYLNMEKPVDAEFEDTGEIDITPAETPEPVDAEKLDYDKMFALYEPEMIVAKVDGKDIDWAEYFSWLYMSAIQTEQYFVSMASYGLPLSWDDPVGDDPEETYATTAVEAAGESLKQILTYEGLSEQNGFTLPEDLTEQMEQQREQDRISTVGEDGTEEDFQEYLDKMYMSAGAYERMSRINFVNANNYNNFYGVMAADVTDEQAMNYLIENEYLHASHILFLTKDMSTGEDLDEKTAEEKKLAAQELAQELQAIEDKEELVKVFKEKKAELCEDSGKTAYPDGYVFLPGEMVPEFENGTKELEDYQVSEPILSSYGYHIILRLPLDVDAVISYDNSGNAGTARQLYASYDYASKLDEYYKNMSFEFVEGFEAPELSEFVK